MSTLYKFMDIQNQRQPVAFLRAYKEGDEITRKNHFLEGRGNKGNFMVNLA